MNPIVSLAAIISTMLASQAFAVQVDASLEPNPPKMGRQTALLSIKDDSGKPLEKALVSAEIVMPPMAGMGEMKSKGKFEEKGKGAYELKFNVSMEGKWYLVITTKNGSREEKAFFELETGVKGLRSLPGIPAGGGMEGHAHH